MKARIGEAQLQDLATRALQSFGVAARDAADCARILVLGDLFGLGTHGTSRIETYGERLRLGAIKARPDIRLEKVAPTLARLDGDNGVGPLVGMRALEAALAMAREFGMGMVFARTAITSGRLRPIAGWLPKPDSPASSAATLR